MQLSALALGDPPGRWAALGFAVVDGRIGLGGVTLELGDQGSGITAWSLPALDGLATFTPAPAPSGQQHPNGAVGIDHVVILTPAFERTVAALEAAELPLKRIRDAGGFRQGFRRAGPAIIELVEARGEDRNAPARFWGLVVIAADLEALKTRVGDRLSDSKPAVQPGRRIATLRESAGIGCAVAFMTPEP